MYIQYFNYTKHNYILAQTKITHVHYVYRITNLINNKFYIGKHSHCLSNKYDDYMGGGNLIVKAIKKYGKESFKKEIISYYKTSSCALIGEGTILTKDIANQDNCYNLKAGGEGGSAAGRKLKEETIIKRTKSQKGLKRSEETRKRLSLAKKGKKINHIKKEIII
jgi:group I intron endonuclease